MAARKDNDKAAEEQAPTADQPVEQGFRGLEVDPTPNENYTAAGVTSGKPTPETDDNAAEEARQARGDVARRAAGVAGK